MTPDVVGLTMTQFRVMAHDSPTEIPTPAPPSGATTAGRARWVRLATRWGVVVILAGVALNLGMAYLAVRAGAVRTIQAVSPSWILAAAVLGLVPTLLHGIRIRIWAGFLDTPTRLRGSMRAAWGTELGSSIAPKAIGGAPVKLGLLMDSGMSAGTAASIVMLNNFEDIVAFTIVMPAIAVATRRWDVPEVQEALGRIADRVFAAGPWLLLLVALIAGGLWLRHRLRDRRAPRGEVGPLRAAFRRVRGDFFEAYALVGRRGKLRFVAAVATTTIQWIARCSVGTAILYGLGRPVDPILFFLLQWVVWMTMVFVPTPGAALGAEASFAAVMSGFVGGGILGLVGAAWRFLSFYLVLLVGLAMVPLLGVRPSRSAAPSPGPP